jgi:hypothetical protein
MTKFKSKAKSTRKTVVSKPVTPDPPVEMAKTSRSLIITLPILAAVLFAIGYVQMRTTPIDDKSDTQTQAATTRAAAGLPTLLIAPQTQGELAPLPVSTTESLSVPSSNIGDANASAAAQPTITSLQAPMSTGTSDDGTIQAHKSPSNTNDLMNL